MFSLSRSHIRGVPIRHSRTQTSRCLSSLASSSDALSVPPPESRYARLSRFWLASGGLTATEGEDSHEKLIRAGYLRQSQAGIFHMLPLGQRVQEKLENLIDKHMLQLGASKVSLSAISSQALWQQTNRLEGYGPELFRFVDRKDVPHLLAPTHEEEITSLVAKTVRSYKGLPLRLYQIGRKYRDEIRPRHGVLRSREFIMKDLYTFDYSTQTALSTYKQVREAYSRLFDELKLPYVVAEASSGDIGGDLSHEYHLPTAIGEDNVISCDSCEYVANEEIAVARTISSDSHAPTGSETVPPAFRVWRGISKDRTTLVNVWYPAAFSDAEINTYAIKSILPELDSSLEDPATCWESALASAKPAESGQRLQLLNVIDGRLGPRFADTTRDDMDRQMFPPQINSNPAEVTSKLITSSDDGGLLNVLRIRDGDYCPRCSSGTLKVQKAIELGHTFHLGTRYSDPLDARVQVPSNLVDGQLTASNPESMVNVSMQMGCHGIGVSRIIGAVADHLADDKGLSWPRAIAPFEVVVIPGRKLEEEATKVADYLTNSMGPFSTMDLALDDRSVSFPWKMNDADLIGYPVIVVLGRKWNSDRLCEVQCRRLATTSHVALEDLPMHINKLLSQL
ncbi:Uu.00g015910.m01.CDS01 [Anthostomella pinea]|uniref:proline--tRNA ligase n=1 Tax=Anthostomella pinea TaxID=933095 RepID=A0AAI8YN82_9PEZI|nr:Uu.00g015910.m01.CDS01 [Anthostomella pinea]